MGNCVSRSEMPEQTVEETGTNDLDEKEDGVVTTGWSEWRKITGVGDLWRFTTGYTPSAECVPGDECIVLRTEHGHYCEHYKENKWMRNKYNETGGSQKFKVNYIGNGQITLECCDGYWVEASPADYPHYIYCCRTPASQSPKQVHKFYVYVLDGDGEYEKEWRACIKSAETGKFWSARKGIDSWMIHQKDKTGSWERFRGYKMGKKEDWIQRDEWQAKEKLHNYTSETDTMKFNQTVGSSFTKSTTVTVEASAGITLGSTFGEGFSKSIQSSVGYSWSTTSSNTWYEEETYEIDAPVGPGKTVQISQIVGIWGNVVSKTPEYKTEECEE